MAGLITLLIILFSTVVPILFSKSKSPRSRLRMVQYATVAMTFVWAYLCLTYYPQLVDLN
jgi:hypothetical protein